MCKTLSAAVAGLAAVGGAAAIASAAQAQPYGFYGYGRPDYGYRYQPPRAYGYDGRYTPYSYYNGYDGRYAGYNGGSPGRFGRGVMGHAPYDEYGPDPNGLIAPDGHRIKCKLVNGGYRTRRECW